MLNIAVCDDMQIERRNVECELGRYLSDHHLTDQVNTEFFSSPEELLKRSETEPFDLYLLDVLMPHITGISVAEKIRARQPEAQFIFITTTSEFFMDAAAVKALYYLLKPYTSEDFDTAMDKSGVFSGMNDSDRLSVTVSGGARKEIDPKDFVYALQTGKGLKVYLLKGNLLLREEDLNSFSARLKDREAYCCPDGTRLISLDNIRNMKEGAISLRNGDVLKISGTAFEKLKAAFLAYYEG